ncbi:unnamed protein product [Linum tenue]|uniref:Uncharacterized protein n=1 Tax=Linum tenue TaxID=586396 RepID=A0AAV0PWQ7_9ROSI|nr:unnamed protein product [Linum tenue]
MLFTRRRRRIELWEGGFTKLSLPLTLTHSIFTGWLSSKA